MKKLIFLFCAMFSFLGHARGGRGGDELTRTGVYWVPVGPEHIQYGMFFISAVEIKNLGESIKIEYDLPVELTGVPNRIELEGPLVNEGPMHLTGPMGKADCPRSGEVDRCKISYQGLTYDPALREQHLKSISKSPAELTSRQAVAWQFQFGGEPGGFLSVNP